MSVIPRSSAILDKLRTCEIGGRAIPRQIAQFSLDLRGLPPAIHAVDGGRTLCGLEKPMMCLMVVVLPAHWAKEAEDSPSFTWKVTSKTPRPKP